jgi:hypothetical protein
VQYDDHESDNDQADEAGDDDLHQGARGVDEKLESPVVLVAIRCEDNELGVGDDGGPHSDRPGSTY